MKRASFRSAFRSAHRRRLRQRPTMGLLDELKGLLELKSVGALTAEEFDEAKAAVILASKAAASPAASPAQPPAPAPAASPAPADSSDSDDDSSSSDDAPQKAAAAAAALASESKAVKKAEKAAKKAAEQEAADKAAKTAERAANKEAEQEAAAKGAKKAAKEAARAAEQEAAEKNARKAAKKEAAKKKKREAAEQEKDAPPAKRAKKEPKVALPPAPAPRDDATTARFRASTVETLKSWSIGQTIAGNDTGAVFGGNAGSGTFRTGFPGVGVSCFQVGEDYNPDILRSTAAGEIWIQNSPDLTRKADGLPVGYALPLLTRPSKTVNKGAWTFRGWYELVGVVEDDAAIREVFANREVPKPYRKMLASGHKVTMDPAEVDEKLKFAVGRIVKVQKCASPF